jgi:D-alanyl-D-alanine carboxypeptidase
VTVTPEMAGIEGSSIYLQPGEHLTVEQLLGALLLESANDAAVALAITCSQSVEAFAEAMNRKAAELGLTDTHFTNPHGLSDESHYTTAHELARVTRAALQNETFRRIVSTYKTTVPRQDGEGTRVLINHNKLLRRYDGCIGVKTGYTRDSGRCLVSAAERDGLTLIAVTLNASNDWNDHTALLDWGFSQYASVLLAPAGGFSVRVPVTGAAESDVVAVNPTELRATLPRPWGNITYRVQIRRFEYAPIAQGQTLGSVAFYCNGKLLAESELVALHAVPVLRPAAPSLIHRFKGLWGGLRDWIAAWFHDPLETT